MPRSWYINGPTLVKVRGGAHLGMAPVGAEAELGLTLDQVKIRPVFHHQDINMDAYGRPPNVAPANVMWMGAEYLIQMKLAHYDPVVLDTCMSESMGGAALLGRSVQPAGTEMAPPGRLLGNGADVLSSGNHFMQLTLTSPVGFNPYLFTSCYLTGSPMEIPLGAERSVVLAEWRGVPFVPQTSGAVEIKSSGVQILTHIVRAY